MILALDQSLRCTGIALITRGGTVTTVSTGKNSLKNDDWLAGETTILAIQKMGLHPQNIEVIVYESPFLGVYKRKGETESLGRSPKAYFRGGVFLGHVVGVLRTLAPHAKIAQVSPKQGKLALTGKGDATKHDMVENATDLWPELPGLKTKAEREAVADAIGVGLAYIKGLSRDG